MTAPTRTAAQAAADDKNKPLTVPSDAAGLEALLNDTDKMKLVTADANKFGEFIQNYAKTILDKDMSIATQVRDEVQRVTAEFLKENGQVNRPSLSVSSPQVDPKAAKAGTYNAKAMGAALDSEFESAAEFFQLIWHARNGHRDAKEQAKIQRIRAAFSSNVPSEGGFLIPETLRAELLALSLEAAVIRPLARVVPMESLRVPYPMVDSTTNQGSVHGGIVTYWTEESARLQRSAAKFGRVVLDAKKLTAYAVVPNELISDSAISFEAYVRSAFPEALAFGEDVAFFNGSGVGEPLGFMGSTAMVSVAKETSQAADTIVWENVVKMYSRMLPSSLNRAVWIASPSVFPALATMALSVGTGGSAVWLNNGVEGPPMTILGRPVIFSEKGKQLGDAGDLVFADLGYYLIGDRQVMSASSSEHINFDTDETAFRFIQRVDGRPWIQSAITPQNGGDTLSPFVQIAERA